MQKLKDFLHKNEIEIASFKNLFNILAIVIAGLWVVYNFKSIKQQIDDTIILEKTKKDQFDQGAIQIHLTAKQLCFNENNLLVLIEVSIINKGDKNQTLYFPIEPLKIAKAVFSDSTSIPIFPKDKIETIKYSRIDHGLEKMRDSLLSRKNVEWKFSYVIKLKETGLYYARFRIPVVDTINNLKHLNYRIDKLMETKKYGSRNECIESLPSFHGEIFLQVEDKNK